MAGKKKGGHDDIEPAMIKHLSKGSKRWSLNIINHSWQDMTGQLKMAIIIPLLKNGKNTSRRVSYRPVSLTPYSSKSDGENGHEQNELLDDKKNRKN